MYVVYIFAALAKLGLGIDWVSGRALQLWMLERTPESVGRLGAPLPHIPVLWLVRASKCQISCVGGPTP